ncbi:MAG: HAD family phosphatase [Parachlamydiaceae bacterium]|nr:HAD family phosphatase [Parachlamydiaceae bacterium]
MNNPAQTITTIFLDVGGVILTNGWDHLMRKQAAEKFHFNLDEFNERHGLAFVAFEEGKITLDEYLNLSIFYKKRDFSIDQFKEFMYAQSKPFPEMIALIKSIKKQYGLKVFAVSNEGKELMLHRINSFKLREFVDAFVCSCFINMRKPDPDFYRLALDISQAKPSEIVYIDDRPMLVEIGKKLGFHGIIQKDLDATKETLMQLLGNKVLV